MKNITLLILIVFAMSLSAANSYAANRLEFADDVSAPAGKPVKFFEIFEAFAERRGLKTSVLCDETDFVSRRVLREYGAVFLSAETVVQPTVCVFESEREVAEFQKQTPNASVEIGGATIELQASALDALKAAREEAAKFGLDITPRDGAEAGRRSYADTLRLWNSRFLPALKHWQKRGRISSAEAAKLQAMPIREQVAAVLELEKRGMFFSRDLSKSILQSVAAPGTSQHLSLLAFDANEFSSIKVRKILARHGWFRTVKNDPSHFTFLGLPEKSLPASGLRKVNAPTGEYWVPNV
jgi:hypothetical protein